MAGSFFNFPITVSKEHLFKINGLVLDNCILGLTERGLLPDRVCDQIVANSGDVMRYLLVLLLCFPLSLWAQSNPTCGNGTVDPGEQCDDGNENSDTLQNHCRGNCTLPKCGDSVVDVSEVCDDGNTNDGDVCSSDCQESYQGKSSLTSIEAIDETPNAGAKDPDKALRLAVLTTFFGPPVVGFLYGPSIGHFYAGETNRAIGMTLARTAIAGATAGIVKATIDQKIPARVGFGLEITGALVIYALVAADLIDAPKAAKRANEKRKKQE